MFVYYNNWTENAGPENGEPKKMKDMKMQDLKIKDLLGMRRVYVIRHSEHL